MTLFDTTVQITQLQTRESSLDVQEL